eukprot:scaffold7392_cov286-Pinguiococcus_pyrenoidosus.AAC.26
MARTCRGILAAAAGIRTRGLQADSELAYPTEQPCTGLAWQFWTRPSKSSSTDLRSDAPRPGSQSRQPQTPRAGAEHATELP